MQKFEATRECLGTLIKIEVVAYDEAKALSTMERAFKEAERIESLYSRFIKNNELAKLNVEKGTWSNASEELYELVSFGLRVHERSNGFFDMSVKTILDGWGYNSDYSLQEGEHGRIGKVQCKDGKIKIEEEIDLGGLGKGYAIDRMINELHGFPNVLINAGGDIFAQGKDLNSPWRVALEHPLDYNQAIGVVEVDNFSICASNPSKRKWRNKHHLVNPLSGEPANNMLAVYTKAPAGILADAYSTALFAMGFEKARELAPNLPVEVLLIAPDGKGWMSEGFNGTLFHSEMAE